ncbi:single-stranded DNA-binding protein [Deinococcus sp. QL22]|uniref:single-stranded DNA-binding protein n=1 Tax=Deinococcus sp. QL22 TaxID=2939437 RepID=UPI0020170467|nr:single-stranded DNA-binding protein [Deinococcus sp. QL22]UQN09456.1 single-stranded DNA-binding protein [Deinococcus sp. QL22]
MNKAIKPPVRTPATRAVSGTHFAEATVALDSILNGRKITNYLPLTFIGSAATSAGERLTAGTTVSVQATVRQEKWASPEGQKRSKVRLQALRHEVLDGDFATIADRNGGQRLAEGVNSALLGGNLVSTPEVRYTPAGDAVTDFTLALNEKFTNRASEPVERTSFVEVTAWKELAVKVASMVKGTPLTVIGAAISDSWTDKDGNKRSALKFEAAQIFMVQPSQGGCPELAPATASGQPGVDLLPPEGDLPF